MDLKPSLRTRISLVRARRSAAERVTAGQRIAEHAVAAWSGLQVVAAYAAVGSEPPTRPLLDGLRECGVAVWLPVVEGDRLDWAPYDGWDQLAVGPFGLRQPGGVRLGVDALRRSDLVLVPALAADAQGNRLGRGGGFYDRALAGVVVPTVAVVFEDEVLDEIPTEPHDVRLDGLLTPAGLVATAAEGRSVPGVPRPR